MQITKQDLRNIGRGRYDCKHNKYLVYGMVMIAVIAAAFMSIGYLADDGKDLPSIYQEINTDNTIEVDGVLSSKITIDGKEYTLVYESTANKLTEGLSLFGAVIGFALFWGGYAWYFYSREMAGKIFQYEAEKDNTLEIIDEERRINEV